MSHKFLECFQETLLSDVALFQGWLNFKLQDLTKVTDRLWPSEYLPSFDSYQDV